MWAKLATNKRSVCTQVRSFITTVITEGGRSASRSKPTGQFHGLRLGKVCRAAQRALVRAIYRPVSIGSKHEVLAKMITFQTHVSNSRRFREESLQPTFLQPTFLQPNFSTTSFLQFAETGTVLLNELHKSFALLGERQQGQIATAGATTVQ